MMNNQQLNRELKKLWSKIRALEKIISMTKKPKSGKPFLTSDINDWFYLKDGPLEYAWTHDYTGTLEELVFVRSHIEEMEKSKGVDTEIEYG